MYCESGGRCIKVSITYVFDQLVHKSVENHATHHFASGSSSDDDDDDDGESRSVSAPSTDTTHGTLLTLGQTICSVKITSSGHKLVQK